MGYSSRYHIASLAAIFVALAVGVLIGVGFGSSPQKSLERSLKGDLKDARVDADRLGGELKHEREFGDRVYPVLVGGHLQRERVALIALGGLPENLSSNIEDALQPAGAKLTEVAVVRLPPSLDGLAQRLPKKRFPGLARGGPALERYGRVVGVQLVRGGGLLRRTRDQLLSRTSGRLGNVDDVIIVRDQPSDLTSAEARATNALEDGLVAGIKAAGTPAVAVERSDSEASSVGFFASQQLSTVDDLDLVAGRVAMVFALLGAEGNFGVKESADRLLPELLVPSRSG
jgi:copper transport outer membrane protein MctB